VHGYSHTCMLDVLGCDNAENVCDARHAWLLQQRGPSHLFIDTRSTENQAFAERHVIIRVNVTLKHHGHTQQLVILLSSACLKSHKSDIIRLICGTYVYTALFIHCWPISVNVINIHALSPIHSYKHHHGLTRFVNQSEMLWTYTSMSPINIRKRQSLSRHHLLHE
jgi:hypothetical protein